MPNNLYLSWLFFEQNPPMGVPMALQYMLTSLHFYILCTVNHYKLYCLHVMRSRTANQNEYHLRHLNPKKEEVFLCLILNSTSDRIS